jgi:YfiH family protein
MNEPQLHFYDLGTGVTAFSTTRHGGCSEGRYARFNANAFCGDQPQAVAANREALCRKLGVGLGQLLIPHQVHGTCVAVADEDFMALSDAHRASRLEGVDALVTSLRGVCICVSTADCMPVLLYDPQHQAVAAIHAGWRGTVARIVEHAVGVMQSRYHTDAAQLRAVVGPGISLRNFEVGDEVYDAFARQGFPMQQLARRFPLMNGSGAGEKWHIDLPLCNALQLQATGVPKQNILLSGICTYDQHETFFSARRLSIHSGRILTGILLK